MTMDPQTVETVRACSRRSLDGTMAFPEVVGRLMAAGIERYHADLVRGEKTYYLPNGAWEVVAGLPAEPVAAMAFSTDAVIDAIRAAQSGRVRYPEFLQRIKAAGCVGYLVSLSGQRAVYYGRTGEMHVEHFPPA